MADLDQIVEELSKLTVMEAAELSKRLEESWGVSAAAPAAVAAAAPGAAGAAEAAVEEQTEFSVHILAAGDNRVSVIKEIRAASGLGLKEAKTLMEEAPKPVKEGVPRAEAEEILKKLEAVGAKAEIKLAAAPRQGGRDWDGLEGRPRGGDAGARRARAAEGTGGTRPWRLTRGARGSTPSGRWCGARSGACGRARRCPT